MDSLSGVVNLSPADEAKSVCDLIDRWARKQPDHPAIIFGSRIVSYQSLVAAASEIAWTLLQNHVKPGDFVPVLATRSCEMVAAFLGVLKAGACYVPIDIELWGEERIVSTLNRISARVIVNLGSSVYPEYSQIQRSAVESMLTSVIGDGQRRHLKLPQTQIEPTDLAYMVFTSGTTSEPKGVMISHRSLLNYVQQGDQDAPFNCDPYPHDKNLLTFSPGFDACAGVLFSTLSNGAQLMVAEMSGFESCAAQATILAVTPSMLSVIRDVRACSQLRILILGGEVPQPKVIEKWSAPGRRIYNGYGPTETTISSLMGIVEPGKPITLGRTMSNSRVVLLDGDVESDYGEICLTGPGLAVGYYKDEALTAQKFIYRNGERMYRTGDFAHRTIHGLEFAGRADSFVKNRGLLVNIDSQVIPLLLGGGAQTATAFKHNDQLVAFVTPNDIDARALRRSLLQHHDAFLVPDQVRTLDVLPLTANGKLDNKTLHKLLDVGSSDEGAGIDEDKGLPHRTKMDALKSAISSATSLPISEMSDECSFMDLGGNSLAALQVLSYLRTFRFKLGLKTLLELPSLTAVCDSVSYQSEEPSGISGTDGSTTGPMTNLQVRMVQASLKTPGANAMLLRIKIPYQTSPATTMQLKQAWHLVMNRHAIFRTDFLLREELQLVETGFDLDWREEETTKDEMDDVVHGRSLEIRRKTMSLIEHDGIFTPVNMFHFISAPEAGSILLLSAHHAQADGWSLSIVLDEVQRVLQGKQLAVIDGSSQFLNVASTQKLQESDPEGHIFWERILEHASDLPKVDLPKPSSNEQTYDWTRSKNTDLGISILELQNGARLLNVTPSALLYTAWGLVLSNYTSSESVGFGAVFSGRNLMTAMSVERIVGPMLNTVPFCIDFSLSQTVKDAVFHVNSQLLQMVEFQWSATKAMASKDNETIKRVMQTLVVTEYDLPPAEEPSSWTVEREDLMEFGLTLLLERRASGDRAQLQARILFDGSRYTQSIIEKLLAHFSNSLSNLMNPQNTFLKDVRSQLMDEKERLSLLEMPNVSQLETEMTADFSGATTITEAFKIAAMRWPDMCAIESMSGRVTYRMIDEASNKLAWKLRQHLQGKCPKNVVIGVLSDGSYQWAVSILSVLKAGCICCPIDVSLPESRIQSIIKHSGARVFLAPQRRHEDRLALDAKSDSIVFVVDDILYRNTDIPARQLETVTSSKDVVYIVFTSGSTGVPKGEYKLIKTTLP
jgi:gliotoxin/aspirochlorine biosynthesis peptide synthetase